MKRAMVFLAITILTLLVSSPAIAGIGDLDDLDITMEVFDDVAHLDATVSTMRGPAVDGGDDDWRDDENGDTQESGNDIGDDESGNDIGDDDDTEFEDDEIDDEFENDDIDEEHELEEEDDFEDGDDVDDDDIDDDSDDTGDDDDLD